jgi:hypothetical protein
VNVRASLPIVLIAVTGGALAFDQTPTRAAATPAAFVRYFADGASGSFFTTRIAVGNPGRRPATVHLTFARTDGQQFTRNLVVAPTSRATISPASMAGLEDAEFSTTVESDQQVVVDRTIGWDASGYASRSSSGVATPSTAWLLAGGATHSGFNLFYAIHNPNSAEADVTVQYLLPSPRAPVSKTYRVAPHSRSTIWVNDESRSDPRLSGLSESDVSASLSSTIPIVAEKTMYLGRPGQMYGAALSTVGATTTATTWLFAEGETGSGFDMFLVVANPGPATASVEARYLLPSGEQITKNYQVAGHSRLRIWVDLEDPRLADTRVAVILSSTNGVGIVAEREMFWPGPTSASWDEAAASTGATVAGTRWGIAGGESGGSRHARTSILLANTSSTTGSVKITLLFEDGTTDARFFRVQSMRRFTVDVGREFASVRERRFAAVIDSSGVNPAHLVVEWSMYTDGPDGASMAGSSAPATLLEAAPPDVRSENLSTSAASRFGAASAFGSGDGTSSRAGSFNIKIVTDASPDLTDMASLIESTTSHWPTVDQKVWALFYWNHILKRQTPPMTLHGFDVTDPIRNLVDYGYTMCSTASGINQSLYEALGLQHQYWDICNHTVSAVEYDGRFHMIDTSMSNLVTLDDGVTLASVPEVVADSARLLREHSLYSTSPNGFLLGSDTGRNLTDFISPVTGSLTPGFADDFCEGLKLRDYYYNWNWGHRYVLNVRDGESYVRYYHPLGTSADYWVSSEKIAKADPATAFQIDAPNKFGLRGNGSWTSTPSLAADGWSAAAYRATNIAPTSGGLAPADPTQPAELVYKVQAADAITSQKIQAQFSRPTVAAAASVSVSLNHGVTWLAIGDVGSAIGSSVPITVNLRDQVNGLYESLIRIQFTPDPGSWASIVLTGLTIDTLTQVNAKALPRLNIGRNQVYIGAGDQTDSMVLWPDLRSTLWMKDAFDAKNITAQAVDVPRKYTAVAYPSTLNQDAYLTYKMDAPGDITRLTYGARLYNSHAGSYIDYLHSFDNGATWTKSYRLSSTSKPYDVIHYETIASVPPGVRTVLFKYLIHNTSTAATTASGLYAARMEADYAPAQGGGRPIDVTFRWKEVQSDRTLVERTFRQHVDAFPTTVTIDVGGSDHPVMESLKVNVEDPSDPTPAGYGDGVDVGGERYVPKKRIEGTNLAKSRPYTISRAPSGFQSSAPASNATILTDGIVGSPVTGSNYYWWGQCWASGATVDLQVDLGSMRSVGAFRAHLFGYPFWDALKGQVQDRVEILTSADGVTFANQGPLPTSLWKKDIPINHMLQDDETATGWNFEQTLPSAVQARYVRYHITPKRTLCVSELQAFDRIDYQPFDLRIALPGSVAPPENVPPAVTLTSPANSSHYQQPSSITVTADAQDTDGTVTRVDAFAGSTLIGSVSSSPFTIVWANAPAGQYVITAVATDDAGATTTSPGVSITIDPPSAPNQPPQVALTSPDATAAFTAPAMMALAADASDPDNAIARVEFFADAASIGIVETSPYRTTWADVPAGHYALTAVATDVSGAATTSAPVNVTVGEGTADNLPPQVNVTSPMPSATFTAPASLSIRATATDPDNAVAQVEFRANGSSLGIATAEPYQIVWPNVIAGQYSLTATATDVSGASTTSAAVQILVTNIPPPPNQPPQVTLTSPTTATAFTAPATVALAANATDPDNAIARVEFFAGATSLGVITAPPYQMTWSNAPAGQYALSAVATDTSSASTISSPVTITIAAAPLIDGAIDEIVLHAVVAPQIAGGWNIINDATAAEGALLQNPDHGVVKVATALPSPSLAFDLTFRADAGKAYRLWLRGKPQNDSYDNDSVYVQFDNSVDVSGKPIWRTNTSTAVVVILEDCSGCGVKGWAWADTGYGRGVLGPLVYFAQGGLQRIRIQAREDGVGIDQIVLSAVKYKTVSPGATKNDTTILQATQPLAGLPQNSAPQVTLTSPANGTTGTAPATFTLTADAVDSDGSVTSVDFFAGSTLIGHVTSGPYTASWSSVATGIYTVTARATDDMGAITTSAAATVTVNAAPPPGGAIDEVVLYPGVDAQVGGGWSAISDPTAAGGTRLQNPDAGQPKVPSPLASPAQYFDVTFDAEAGKPYHLWLRGVALKDNYNNDSVFVQFDHSVDASGNPVWRIDSTSAATIILEDCSGCGVKGWGWNDNGYGQNVVAPMVYFASSGPQRIRIQTREDGLGVDQVVLSAVAYRNTSPGGTKNDSVIVPR